MGGKRASAAGSTAAWPRYGDHYPPGSRADREFQLAYTLVLAARGWMKLIDRLLRTRVEQSRARWETMFAIAFAAGPVTLGEVSELLGLRWPTLVRILDDLERDGIIERTANPADGRSRLISLSPQGREALIRSRDAVDPKRREVMAGLSDAELAICTDLLSRILLMLDSGSNADGSRERAMNHRLR